MRTILALAILASLAGCGSAGTTVPQPVHYQLQATNTLVVVTIEGGKQGKFKGPIKALGYELGKAASRGRTARAGNTGIAGGLGVSRRQPKPIKVIKEWDASSPQLYQAYATNEALKRVRIEVYQASAAGDFHVTTSLTLKDARVSDYSTSAGDSGTREEVSFTYREIEVEDKPGQTSTTDVVAKGR
jgi:type VI secretion system Hcp family effector